MSSTVSGDPQQRPIPNNEERSFNEDLEETLTANIRQLNRLDAAMEDLRGDDPFGGSGGSGGGEDFDSDEGTTVEDLEDFLDQRLEEAFDLFDTNPFDGEYPIHLSPQGVVFGNPPIAREDVDIRGSAIADSLRLVGDSSQLQLEKGSNATTFEVDGDGLGVKSDTITVDTPNVNPARSYETSLGSPQNKYLSVHAAELWIDQLVAQQTRATIGGKVFVGPTSTLAKSLAGDKAYAHNQPEKDRYNYVRTKHNAFNHGDVVMMEARGRVEFMRIASWVPYGTVRFEDALQTVPSSKAGDGKTWKVNETNSVWQLDTSRDTPGTDEIGWDPDEDGTNEGVWTDTGDEPTTTVDDGFDQENPFEFTGGVYRYRVERDLDGTGANFWAEGDAVISTGEKGSGFMELYAQESMREAPDNDAEMLAGPTISFSLREEDHQSWDGAEDEYYNEWGTRTALGRLTGHYDYSDTDYVWGLAAGNPNQTWVSADDTKGFRIQNDDALVGQWGPSGFVRIGETYNPNQIEPSLWRGEWQSGLEYETGDVVQSPSDGLFYIASADHTSAAADAPLGGSDKWVLEKHPVEIAPNGEMILRGTLRIPDGSGGFKNAGIDWQGLWQPGVDYDQGDGVFYKPDGNTYVCEVAHTSASSDEPIGEATGGNGKDLWSLAAEPANRLYLDTDGPRAIKNSMGTVEVIIRELEGDTLSVYTGSDYQITSADQTTAYGTSQTLGPDAIEGQKTLVLEEKSTSKILDTIDVLDVTDGLGGGYMRAPDTFLEHQVENDAFAPTDATLTGVFYRVGETTTPEEFGVTIHPFFTDVGNGYKELAATYTKDQNADAQDYPQWSSSASYAQGDTVSHDTTGDGTADTIFVAVEDTSTATEPQNSPSWAEYNDETAFSVSVESGDGTSLSESSNEIDATPARSVSVEIEFTDPVTGDVVSTGEEVLLRREQRQVGVRATQGTAIKNSSGTLVVEAFRVTEEDNVLPASSNYRLENENGTVLGSGVGTNISTGGDELIYELGADDIDDETDILLKDSGGTTRDSTSLSDITESVVGLVSVAGGQLAYYRGPEGTWQTGTTTLQSQFWQGQTKTAETYVDIAWDGSGFSVTKEPADQSGYQNENDVSITTSTGANVGEEGQVIDVEFEYTNPQGIVQTATKSVFAVASGDATEQRYIRPVDGAAIKNANPSKNLGLEIVEAVGGTDSILTSGKYKLHYKDSNGDFQLLSNLDSGLDNHNPTAIGAERITEGELDVFLRDTGAGETLDSITLADITDGFGGQYVLAPGGREVTRYTVDETAAGAPIDPTSLTLTGVFIPPGESRSARKQDADFTFTESAGSLEADVTIGSQTHSDIEFVVRDAGGSLVFDSAGTDNTPVTDPGRLAVEYTIEDSQTGSTTSVEEQISFTEDPASIFLNAIDGDKIKNGSGTLRFDVMKQDGAGARELTKSEIQSDSPFKVQLVRSDGTVKEIDEDVGDIQTVLPSGSADPKPESEAGRIFLDETDIDGDDTIRVSDGTAILANMNVLDVADGTDGADSIDVVLSRSPKDLVYRWEQDSESYDRTSDTTITATVYKGANQLAQGNAVVSLDPSAGSLSVTDNTGSDIALNTDGVGTGRLGLEFEYTRTPNDSVASSSNLTNIPKADVRDGQRRFVSGTETYWELSTSATDFSGSGEVEWNPDGEATDGVWTDTGQTNVYTESDDVLVIREGQHAESFNVILPEGDLIKNSQGTLEIEARKAKGDVDKRLTKSDGFRFADGQGTVLDANTSGVSQLGSAGDLYYELSAGAIDSSTDVFLHRWDGSSLGQVVESRTLSDLTESIVPIVTYSPTSGRFYHQQGDQTWETGTTTIQFDFMQGPGNTPQAQASVDVGWDGSEDGTGWTVTTNTTSTQESGASITVSSSTSTYSADVEAVYENESGITQVAQGSVTAFPAGELGDDAQSVRLEAESQVFVEKSDGSHSPADITLTAHSENISGASYTWTDGNGNQIGTGSNLTVNHSQLSGGSLTVTLTEGATGLTDTTTLHEVSDGRKAVTAALTNPSHTFAAGPTGEVDTYAGGATTVEAWEGSANLSEGGGTPGFTVSVASENNVSGSLSGATYTPSSMTANEGSVELSVSITRSDGSAETKTVTASYSKSFAGAQAPLLKLLSPSTVFTDLQDEDRYEPSSITLESVYQNISSPTLTWEDKNGNELGTGQSLTVEPWQLDDGSLEVHLKEEITGLEDAVTITEVREGTEAFTTVLSNENHAFPSTIDGEIRNYDTGNCEIRVYEGATELTVDQTPKTSDVAYSTISTEGEATFDAEVDETGITGTLDKNQQNRIIYEPDSMSADEASVLVTVTITRADGTTEKIDREITYVKSKAAESTKIRASGLVLKKQKDGTYKPDPDNDSTAEAILTGVAPNVESPAFNWSFDKGGLSDITDQTAVEVTPPMLKADGTLEVTMTEATTGQTDTATVTEVAEGTDAITSVLSNESHTFIASADGVVDSFGGGNCGVSVYEGATQLSVDTGGADESFDVSVASETNVSGTLDKSGANEIVYEPSSMTADEGSVELTITATRADGSTETVTRIISYTRSRRANSTRILASGFVLRKKKDKTYKPDPDADGTAEVILTGQAPNVDTPDFHWDYGETGTDDITGQAEVEVEASDLESDGTLTVKMTEDVTGETDTVTIAEIEEGADSVQTVLTNENHTYPADENGNVTAAESDGATGIRAYEGGTQLPVNTSGADESFDVSVASETGMSGTLSKTGGNTSATYTPDSISDRAAAATLDITVTRADGSAVTRTRTLTYSKAVAGTKARTVVVSAASQVFRKDNDNNYSPSSITVDANVTNISSPSYSWTSGNTSYSDSGGSTTVSPSDLDSEGRLQLTAEETGTGRTDSITIVEVEAGDDAVTGVVSNPTHTFPSTPDGAVSNFDGASSTVTVYEGATKLTYDDSASPGDGTFEVSYSVSDNDGSGTNDLSGNTSTASKSWTFTPVSMEKSAETAQVTLTITATLADGSTQTTERQLSYTKAQAGGAAYIEPTALVFKEKQGGAHDPATVTLYGRAPEVDSPSYDWDTSGDGNFDDYTDTGSIDVGHGDLSSGKKEVSMKETSTGRTDTVTLTEVAEGSNAIQSVLSNQSHTFLASADGVVESPGGGDCGITVYEGDTQLSVDTSGSPAPGTFDATIASSPGISGSLSKSGSTVTFEPDGSNTMTADEASVTVEITPVRENGTTGSTITRVISYSRVRPGNSARIEASGLTFAKAQDDSYAPSTITLTGKAPNVDGAPSFAWEKANGNSVGSGSSITIQPEDLNDGSLTVTMTETLTGQTDTVTIVEVEDGSSALKVALGNENHTYPAGPDGTITAPLSGGNCAIYAYEGTTELTNGTGPETFDVSVASRANIGSSDSLDDSTHNNRTIYKPGGSDGNNTFSTDSGSVVLDVAITGADGNTTTLTRTISYSKSLKGDDGVDAKTVQIGAESQVFVENEDDTYTPSAIQLTASNTNIPSPNYEWTSPNTGYSDTGPTTTVEPILLDSDGRLEIKLTEISSGATDTTTILDTASGSDGVTVGLDNENHAFRATADGTIDDYTAGNCEVTVYQGSTQLTVDQTPKTSDVAYSTISTEGRATFDVEKTENGISGTLDKDQQNKIIYKPASMDSNVEEATVNLTATVTQANGETTKSTRQITYSRVRNQEFYAIRALNGRVIRNSNPNTALELQVVRTDGQNEEDMTTGPSLHTYNGSSYEELGAASPVDEDPYNPTIGASQIEEGNLKLYLYDGSKVLDTITLSDLTDGVGGYFVEAPDGLTITYFTDGSPETTGDDFLRPDPVDVIGTFVPSVDGEPTETTEVQIETERAENGVGINARWVTPPGSTDLDSVSVTDVDGNDVPESTWHGPDYAGGPEPSQWTVGFSTTDPASGKTVGPFKETVYFTKDFAEYWFDNIDGKKFKTNSDGERVGPGSLTFGAMRTNAEEDKLLTLDGTPYKAKLFDDTDGTASRVIDGQTSASTFEIGYDEVAGSAELKLYKNDSRVNTINIVDQKDGTDGDDARYVDTSVTLGTREWLWDRTETDWTPGDNYDSDGDGTDDTRRTTFEATFYKGSSEKATATASFDLDESAETLSKQNQTTSSPASGSWSVTVSGDGTRNPSVTFEYTDTSQSKSWDDTVQYTEGDVVYYSGGAGADGHYIVKDGATDTAGTAPPNDGAWTTHTKVYTQTEEVKATREGRSAAKQARITAPDGVFVQNADGTYRNTPIPLTAQTSKLPGPLSYDWTIEDGSTTNKSGTSINLSSPQNGSDAVVDLTVTDGSGATYEDTETFPVVKQGTDGIVASVTNDTHQFPVNPEGDIIPSDLSGGQATVRIYEGATQLTITELEVVAMDPSGEISPKVGETTGTSSNISLSNENGITGGVGSYTPTTPYNVPFDQTTVTVKITAEKKNGTEITRETEIVYKPVVNRVITGNSERGQDAQAFGRLSSGAVLTGNALGIINAHFEPNSTSELGSLAASSGDYATVSGTTYKLSTSAAGGDYSWSDPNGSATGYWTSTSSVQPKDRWSAWLSDTGDFYLNDASDASALEYVADFNQSKGMFAVGDTEEAKTYFGSSGYGPDNESYPADPNSFFGYHRGVVALNGQVGGLIGEDGLEMKDNKGETAVRIDNDYVYEVQPSGTGGGNDFSDPISSDDSDQSRSTGHTLKPGANNVTLTVSGNAGEISIDIRDKTYTYSVPSVVRFELYAKSSGTVLKDSVATILNSSNSTENIKFSVDAVSGGTDYTGEELMVRATAFYEGEGGSITIDEANVKAYLPATEINSRGVKVALGDGEEVRMGAGGFRSTIGMESTVYSFPKGGRIIDEGSGLFYVTGTTSRRLDAEKVAGSVEEADKLDGNDGAYYLNASNINAGTLGTSYVPDLSASKITSGTFDAARIPDSAQYSDSDAVSAIESTRITSLRLSNQEFDSTADESRGVVVFDKSAGLAYYNDATNAPGGDASGTDATKWHRVLDTNVLNTGSQLSLSRNGTEGQVGLSFVGDVSWTLEEGDGEQTTIGGGQKLEVFGGTDLSTEITSTGAETRLRVQHKNTSGASNASAGSSQVVDGVNVDGRGHVTSLSTTGRHITEWNDAKADLKPNTAYEHNIGAASKKWLALHAAELRVANLVSANELITQGGRQIVGTSTQLIEAISVSASSIKVKHNNLGNGDWLHLEARGNYEAMKVISAANSVSGGYEYSVNRNSDGAGANAWEAGDAVWNRGESSGYGFIDQYAVEAHVDDTTASGPSTAYMYRYGSARNDVEPRALSGNLSGFYGYDSDTFGFAAGSPSGEHITVESSNGLRIQDGSGNTAAQLTGSTFSIGSLSYDASANTLSIPGGAVNVASLSSISDDVGVLVSGKLQDSASNPDTVLDFTNNNMQLDSVTLTGSITTGAESLGGWTVGNDTIQSAPTGSNDVNEMVLDGTEGILQITDSSNTDNVLAIGNINFGQSISETVDPWFEPDSSSSCDVETDRCVDSGFGSCDPPPYSASCNDPGPNSYNNDSDYYFGAKANVTYRISYALTTSTTTSPSDIGTASASADAYAKIQLRDGSDNLIKEKSQSISGNSNNSGMFEISTSDSSLEHVRVEVGTQTTANADDPEEGYFASSASSSADASTGALQELGGTNEFISSKGLSFNKAQTASKRVGIKRNGEWPAIGGAILVGEWELVQNSNDDLIAHHPPSGTETTLATSS